MDIMAQLFAAIAIIISLISFQINDRRKLILIQILSTCLWSMHYTLIGALTGGVLALINAFRNIVFYNRDVKKWASSVAWYYCYVIICIISMIFTWKGYASVIATTGTLIYATSLWQRNVKILRYGSIVSAVLWTIYNVLSGSILGVVNEILIIVSLTIAIVRYDLKKGEVVECK